MGLRGGLIVVGGGGKVGEVCNLARCVGETAGRERRSADALSYAHEINALVTNLQIRHALRSELPIRRRGCLRKRPRRELP